MRPGSTTIRSISKRRPSCSNSFSTTTPAAALSPYRKSQKSTTEQTRRPATTAAAQTQYVVLISHIPSFKTDPLAEQLVPSLARLLTMTSAGMSPLPWSTGNYPSLMTHLLASQEEKSSMR